MRFYLTCPSHTRKCVECSLSVCVYINDMDGGCEKINTGAGMGRVKTGETREEEQLEIWASSYGQNRLSL